MCVYVSSATRRPGQQCCMPLMQVFGVHYRTYYDPSAADVAAEEDVEAEPDLERDVAKRRRGRYDRQASAGSAVSHLGMDHAVELSYIIKDMHHRSYCPSSIDLPGQGILTSTCWEHNYAWNFMSPVQITIGGLSWRAALFAADMEDSHTLLCGIY